MGMTIEDCTKMLIAKEKCMERDTSGIDTECNLHNCDDCSLCYEQGTMGEQKEALKFAVDTMRKYQQLQADYEARLKADLKAILVELQLEIHELENPYPHDYDNLLLLAQHNAFYDAKSTIEDLVDEKIKA